MSGRPMWEAPRAAKGRSGRHQAITQEFLRVYSNVHSANALVCRKHMLP